MGSVIAFSIALAVAVSAIFWLILKNSAEKITAQYRALAQALDLELQIPEPKMLGFMRPEPSLYGRYRGRELSLSVPGKGLQNTRQTETVLKIELRENTLAAQFAKAGLLGRLKQRDSGGQARWKSGHPDFDAAVDVRTNHSERLQQLLEKRDLTLIAALLKQAKGALYIGNGTLVYAETGLIGNDAIRQRFESVIEFLCDFAETVEA